MAKLKFNLYRFSQIVSSRRNWKKSVSPFEFTYLCFWNMVTVMGTLDRRERYAVNDPFARESRDEISASIISEIIET